MRRRLGFWALTILLAGCGRGTDTIVVASKNFSENHFLAELIAQQIERKTGLTVERRMNLGGTFLCQQALVSGQADVYPEYTGTALTAILQHAPEKDPARTLEIVQQEYAERFGAEWPVQFGFDSTFALLVRRDAPPSLRTLSELARLAPEMTIGMNFEFLEREDGWRGLADEYVLEFAGPPKTLDLNLVYQALAAGELDVAVGNATHGLIERLNLRRLEDDRHYFPPYDAGAVARTEALEAHPGLREALEALNGTISLEKMQEINRELDVEQRPAAELAREFLEALP
ncbi:MAG: ABC transporter substrate-binding protein [Acidobacteria bacterium]|nr:ABC transporter substrate-binding protein [Acidobacteriota bacterium]